MVVGLARRDEGIGLFGVDELPPRARELVGGRMNAPLIDVLVKECVPVVRLDLVEQRFDLRARIGFNDRSG